MRKTPASNATTARATKPTRRAWTPVRAVSIEVLIVVIGCFLSVFGDLVNHRRVITIHTMRPEEPPAHRENSLDHVPGSLSAER
jgi:hypothetical protein